MKKKCEKPNSKKSADKESSEMFFISVKGLFGNGGYQFAINNHSVALFILIPNLK